MCMTIQMREVRYEKGAHKVRPEHCATTSCMFTLDLRLYRAQCDCFQIGSSTKRPIQFDMCVCVCVYVLLRVVVVVVRLT